MKIRTIIAVAAAFACLQAQASTLKIEYTTANDNLHTLLVEDGVSFLDLSAKGLTSLTLPNGLVNLEHLNISGNPDLKRVKLPKNLGTRTLNGFGLFIGGMKPDYDWEADNSSWPTTGNEVPYLTHVVVPYDMQKFWVGASSGYSPYREKSRLRRN